MTKVTNQKLPVLKSDEEAEAFVDTADLSEYDLSGFKPAQFELEKKSAQLNMRLPDHPGTDDSQVKSASQADQDEGPGPTIFERPK